MDKAYRTLDQLPPVDNRPVLLRVDFNVPVDEAGRITDDTRIQAALPTIRELRDKGAKVIVMSHRGRPKGPDPALSLRVAADRLGELLKTPVSFVAAVVGPQVGEAVRQLEPGHVLVLENLRFEPGEKSGDRAFAEQLASYGEIYVNDAFGAVHRPDASVSQLPAILPGYAGRLLAREVEVLEELLGHPTRPYWAIVGGSKVSDKVRLLGRLIDQVDGLVIGGGMANTFLVAQGYQLGASKVEQDAVELAHQLLKQAESRQVPVILPRDLVVATGFRPDAPHRTASPDAVLAEEMALDVGPETVADVLQTLKSARTVFWNGPMGVFEWEAFSQGTLAVARGLAELDATVVVGGGDSVAAVTKAGVKDRLTHISTGGGATLELLEGKQLPGLEALKTSRHERG